MLYIVPTPLGNLEDITLRAIKVLGSVEVIACEDTRNTLVLLNHLAIRGPRLISYHEHNETTRSDQLLEWLKAGKSIAIVSDAGMPGISDPGYRLVSRAAQAGIPISVLPGPCAAVTALVLSGLPSDRFTFLGYPPTKKGKRRAFFASVAEAPETLIFYESPRRIHDSLADMIDVLGDRPAMLGRELTKIYEEARRGRLSEILAGLDETVRGEITLVLGGADPEKKNQPLHPQQEYIIKKEMALLCQEQKIGLNEAARILADKYGLTKRVIYQMGVSLKKDSGAEDD